ncbi:MAG: peptidoglycan DD-metalloendopeptidase family protein [bacterium]|nr:peptidoglycan DD-metalloendopeptidase family protein [bacterium]
MFNGFPITKYQLSRVSFYVKTVSILFTAVFLFGNIITALVRDSVTVDEKSYILKDGFPLFTSQKDYIKLVRNYPYYAGVDLMIHTMRQGESYWNVSQQYNISIDTIIAANPFLKSLVAARDTEIVVPERDGVLVAFDDYFDVDNMAELLNFKGSPKGEFVPTFFKIISTDDIRMVFFKNAKPVLVNNYLERLYRFRKSFQSPIKGYYTSLFGDRVDPFLHGMAFHNGIDIKGKYGAPIRPFKKGMVIFSGWRDGYGNTAIIQHHDGYSTLYGHCSSLKAKKGDWVTKDSTIALIGSTGKSTGPHLHFTIMRHGEIINPLLFIW